MHRRFFLISCSFLCFISNLLIASSIDKVEENPWDGNSSSRQADNKALDHNELLSLSELAITGNKKCQEQILKDLLLRKPSEYGNFTSATQILQWTGVENHTSWARAITRLYDSDQWPPKILEILRTNAWETNDPIAQNTLGFLYRDGKGVQQDYAIAIEMFQKGANQENALSQASLADMYRNGKGVKKDNTKAFQWYEKAANQGHAPSQFSLGEMYESGIGITKSVEKAFEWYKKAANRGHPVALEKLRKNVEYVELQKKDVKEEARMGAMYYIGKVVPRDYTRAFHYYHKAAESGHAESQYNLGVMFRDGIGIQQDYSKAVEWYEKAATQGFSAAQGSLGSMYANGTGVLKDYIKAIDLLKKSANQGNPEGQFNLGVMYENGKGVVQDYSKAAEWYEKSAHQGFAQAQNNLGAMYDQGKGVSCDALKAFELYEKSANQGVLLAQYNLGLMYKNGKGVAQDYSKAFEWHERAAIRGNAKAQCSLGVMYYNRQGTIKSYQKALEWTQKAADQGNEQACKNLQAMLSRMGYDMPSQNTRSQASHSNFSGNWEGSFSLKNGSIIRHSQNGIEMDGIFGNTGLTVNTSSINGFELKAPLDVRTNSSREVFIAALKNSGLLD